MREERERQRLLLQLKFYLIKQKAETTDYIFWVTNTGKRTAWKYRPVHYQPCKPKKTESKAKQIKACIILERNRT